MIGFYLTHPQVLIDPAIPVERWSLSDVGRGRIEAIDPGGWLADVRTIITSDETKAVEAAAILADKIGLQPVIHPGMGENDRSPTGFIPPEAFEQAADAFFAAPDKSFRGWETARAAQSRIVAAIDNAMGVHAQNGPILFVGHGAVGTLLKCHLAGRPIGRSEDQQSAAPGGGNIFAFDLETGKLLCDWTPVETFRSPRHE